MKLIIKNSFFALLTAGAVSLVACNGTENGTGTDSTSNGNMTVKGDSNNMNTNTDTNSMANTNTSKSSEQDFINYVVKANTEEVAWLKAGLQNGTSKELKDHAKMMLKDHEKMDKDVKAYLGKTPSVTAPTLDTANVVDISEKKGADWDKAFTNKMVDDHSALLDKLNSAKNDVKDADLLLIINGAIPVVSSHLSMVKEMKDKMK